MKALITLALVAAIALPAAAQEGLFMAPAALYVKGKGDTPSQFSNVAWLMAATDKAFRYKADQNLDAYTDVQIRDVILLHFYRTQEFTDALNLIQARKYAEAKDAFSTIKEQHSKLMSLKNNPGLLAAYYEMECMRKLGDLEGLSKALKSFANDKLTHDLKQRQLEIYVLWDAVRTESWERAESLASERLDRKLAPSHRAQVAYCHGMALEGLGRPVEALLAYQVAMTADSGASEVVARDSALRVLEILNADPEVKESIARYKASDGKDLSRAWTKVLEAGGVASLFKMTLGAGTALPERFEHFLDYKTEPKPVEIGKAEEAPAEEAPAKEAPAKAAKPDAKKPKN